jgi:hypothetical protein
VPTPSTSIEMEKRGQFLSRQMPWSGPGSLVMHARSTPYRTEMWSAQSPCPTQPSTCTRAARVASRSGTSVSQAARPPCLSWTACNGITTSDPSNCCQMAELWLLEERPALYQSGTWLPRHLASKRSSHLVPQLAMPLPSALTLKSALVAAVMATLVSGTSTIRLLSDSSKGTQTEPAASTSHLMAQSYGPEA